MYEHVKEPKNVSHTKCLCIGKYESKETIVHAMLLNIENITLLGLLTWSANRDMQP